MRRIGRPPHSAVRPHLVTRPAGAASWIALALSIGCAGPESGGAPPGVPFLGEHTEHRIVGVPFVPGDPGACGPATLASVLAYWGDPVTVQDIAAAIGAASLAGVLPLDLARYATGRGPDLTVHTGTGSLARLRQIVASDRPVVAFLDLGIGPIRRGHFVVVVGFDDRAERVFLYSGQDPKADMSYRRFVASWRRTGYWTLEIGRAAVEPVHRSAGS